MKHYLVIGLGVLVGLFGLALLTPSHAAADGCDVLATYGPNINDCSQEISNNMGMTQITAGNDDYRSSFISIVQARAKGGNNQQAGAAYIIDHLGGASNWQYAVSQVSISQGTYNDNCENSYYDQPSDSIKWENGSTACGSYYSVILKYKGTVIMAIKEDCGNPLGKLGIFSIPKPVPPPTGNLTNSCDNSSGNFTFKGSFNQQGYGATNAYIGDSGGDKLSTTASNSPVTWTYNGAGSTVSYDSDVWNHGTTVYLWVYDQAAGNYVKVDNAVRDNCAPTGSITIDCNTDGTADLSYDFSDQDGTNLDGSNDKTYAYTLVNNGYQFGSNYSGAGLDSRGFTQHGPGTSDTGAQNVAGDGSKTVTIYVLDENPQSPNADNYIHQQSKVVNCKQPPNSPTGTVSAKCTATTLSWSGDFYDPDGATTATLTGPTVPQNYTSGNSQVTAASPKQFSGSQSGSFTGAGTKTFTLTVKNAGGGASFTKVTTATCPSATVSSKPCPGDPSLTETGGKTPVTVALPDQTAAAAANDGASTSPPPASSNTGGTTYKEYISSSNTTVTSVQDIAVVNGLASHPAIASLSLPHYNDGYQTTTLDYSGYVNNYPYDINQSSVTYNSHYVVYTYKASTTPDCSGLAGSTYKNGSCRKGSVSQAPVYDYPASHTTSSPQAYPNTVDAYAMKACYPRNFTVSNVQVTPGMDNYENPSTGNVNATTAVNYSVADGGAIRAPYSLQNINYTATMYVEDKNHHHPAADTACTPTSPLSGTFVAASSSGTASIGSGITCNFTHRPVALGDEVCANYDIGPIGTEMDEFGNVVPGSSLSAGPLNDPTHQPGDTDPCSTPVYNEPYLQVYGGDVEAGVGFNDTTSCAASSNAEIKTYNTNDAAYHGAGTTVASLAGGAIEGFASAQNAGSSVTGSFGAGAPTILAFANNNGGSGYGGNLGASPGCNPDYAGAAAGTTTLPGADVSTFSGNYLIANDVTVGGQLKSGEHVTIYLAPGKNAYVNSSGITAPAALGSQVSDLPSFNIITSGGGNIYIDAGATTLTGNYIAQGGTIYDCATGPGSAVPTTAMYPTCNTKLTVNGSFVANAIQFQRLGEQGSLRYATNDSGPGANMASEEFDYTPASWLAESPSTGKPPKYDAITSLPPVL